MKITVIRSGGLLGRTEKLGPLGSDELPESLRNEIEEELKRVDFFDLPGGLPGRPIPDGYSFEITIEEEGRSHSVAFSEPRNQVLDPLLRLIESSGAEYQPVPRGEAA